MSRLSLVLSNIDAVKPGFSLSVGPSGLAGAGRGVYISRGEVRAGSLVCLYPGTVYQPQDPVLLQSLGNQFILRCCDGLLLDGNNRGPLSPLIFRSCTGREQVTSTFNVLIFSCSHVLCLQIGMIKVADTSWLTAWPVNPLNVGQV